MTEKPSIQPGPFRRIGFTDPDADGDNYARWSHAAPKMAMALAEAGYPNHHDLLLGRYQHAITFIGGAAPDSVLLRAGHLCGVGDLIKDLLQERDRRCQA